MPFKFSPRAAILRPHKRHHHQLNFNDKPFPFPMFARILTETDHSPNQGADHQQKYIRNFGQGVFTLSSLQPNLLLGGLSTKIHTAEWQLSPIPR